MPAFRYWGLLLITSTQVSGSFSLSLAELDFRATTGGADLCTGGTPGTDSFDAPYSAANLFDNDNATLWRRSANTSVRVWYDFGSAISIQQAWFRLPGGASTFPGSAHGPEGVQVIGSNNGTSWVALASYVLPSRVDGAEYTVDVPAALGSRLFGGSFRLSPGPRAQRVMFPATATAVLRYDAADGGPYRVAGTVKIDGTPAVPVARKVRLFDVVSGRLVRQTWSAADGSFAFEVIRAGEYLVVSDDHTRTYNAVVADRVLAVL